MAMKLYQYKVMKDVAPSQITEDNLNALGLEGWKLVHIQERANGNYDGIFIRE